MISPRNTSDMANDFSVELAEKWQGKDPAISNILQYFSEKTNNVRLPNRDDVTPLELIPYLPEVALFDLLYAPDGTLDDIFVKLLGTRLDDFYGALTGKKASVAAHPYVYKRTLQSCRYCVEKRVPIVVTANALSPKKDFVKVTVLYIPLSTDGTHIDKMFIYNQVRFKSQS